MGTVTNATAIGSDKECTQKFEVKREAIAAEAERRALDLSVAEQAALYGLLNHTLLGGHNPGEQDGDNLRFDIVDANRRAQDGLPVPQRYLDLHGIFKSLLPPEAD